jgi:hypothetical protein
VNLGVSAAVVKMGAVGWELAALVGSIKNQSTQCRIGNGATGDYKGACVVLTRRAHPELYALAVAAVARCGC